MKLHLLIYLLLPTMFLLSCKSDKPTAPEAEAIIINGTKAPSLNVEFLEKPTEADNGNYMEVQVGQDVKLTYTGIEKDEITWTQNGMPLGDGTSLNTTHKWTEPGIKEIKATRSDGENVIVYVMVKGDEIPEQVPDQEPTPEPEPVVSTTSSESVSTSKPKPSNKPTSDPLPSKPDSDGDGVPDSIDECPDQWGLKKFKGCPDSDKDGIPDRLDKCPNIYAKTSDGCPDPIAVTKNEVTEPVKVPLPPEPEWDPIKTGTAGITNTSCKGKKSVTVTTSMTITPQKMAELSYVKVAAEATCIANITITSNDGKKAVQMRNRTLNGGLINEINFQHLGYILKPGVVYTITISPADNDYKVSDLSECNSGNGSSDVLDVSYGGGKVLFGLVYKF